MPLSIDTSFFLFGKAGQGLYIFLFWSLIWKGLALWHSARREEKWWFVALLIINTMGILEILYLAFIAKVFSAKRTTAKKKK